MTEEAVLNESVDVEHFDFDADFQTKICALALKDDVFLRRTSSMLRPEYFENLGEATLVKIALDHFQKYNTTIDDVSLITTIKDQFAKKLIKREVIELIKEARKTINSADISNRDFVEEHVTEFAKKQSMIGAIVKSAELIGKGDYDKIERIIQTAMNVGVNEDGAAYDYFNKDRVTERQVLRLEKLTGIRPPQGVTTGISKLDNLLYHRGWGRRELTCLLGSAKAGKCVTRDTLIFTENGLAEIGDFVTNDVGVDEYKPHVMGILGRDGMEETSHVYNSGLTPTIKITTRKGYTIEGTYHHPMLVMNENGEHVWKRLDELKIGDFMVGMRNQQVYGNKTDLTEYCNHASMPKTMTVELAEWLAIVVGDCSFEEDCISVPLKNAPFIQRLTDLTRSLFNGEVELEKTCNGHRLSSTVLRTFLTNIGVKWGASEDQVVPHAVLKAPRDCVMAFLNTVLTWKNINFEALVMIKGVSKKFVKQLRMLLLNDGIVTSHLNIRSYHFLRLETSVYSSDNFFYDNVAEITFGEAETVDLTVPTTHSFFANGLVSHNTMFLINFSKNAVLAGKNVLYVTLEVGANIISDRLDASITKTNMKSLETEAKSVADKVNYIGEQPDVGKLIIHEYASGTCKPNMLRALLQRYKTPTRLPDGSIREPIRFDMLVVDYGDIMAPNHRTNDSIENTKSIFVDLRAIAFEENIAVLTATQSNREGHKSVVVKAEHVAEDFNKVRTVDLMISINRTEEETSKGEARLYFAASRNQESGFTVVIKQNIAQMQAVEDVLEVY